MISMLPTDDVVSLRCDKQKDAEPFVPLLLKKVQVPEADSCVVRLASDVLPSNELTDTQRQVLELPLLPPHRGLSRAPVLAVELRTVDLGLCSSSRRTAPIPFSAELHTSTCDPRGAARVTSVRRGVWRPLIVVSDLGYLVSRSTERTSNLFRREGTHARGESSFDAEQRLQERPSFHRMERAGSIPAP
jgi:hypothetical protein